MSRPIHKRSRYRFDVIRFAQHDEFEVMIETIPWRQEDGTYSPIDYTRGWILEQHWSARWLAVCQGVYRAAAPACREFERLTEARQWLKNQWKSK